MRKNRIKNIKVKCSVCDKIFHTSRDILLKHKRKDIKRYVCSHKCVSICGGKSTINRNQKGENNPNWKDGISKNKYHYKKIQKQRYPEKIKARELLYLAIKRGKIKKGICLICGNIKVQAHHDDYFKPLKVIWLCKKHHDELHYNRQKAG